jgi:malic enzyme
MDLNNNPETIAFPKIMLQWITAGEAFTSIMCLSNYRKICSCQKAGLTVFVHNIILDASGVTGLLEGHN